MPQDTIWLDTEKTQYIIPSSDSTVPLAIHTTSDKVKDEFEFEQKREKYSSYAFPATLILLGVLWILVKKFSGKDAEGYVEIGSGSSNNDPVPSNLSVTADDYPSIEESDPCLVYEGDQLNFSNTELISMLNKRSAYFTRLDPFEKEKFIKRLQQFIAKKTFNIHDSSGFKEMPVLISAAAIQLSFGMENYLLPDFPTINIYPQEFLGLYPNIRFLEGNVSDNCINISWKHFLLGFAIPDNGDNVGLHELAHAYYYQNLQCRECEDSTFKDNYSLFESTGNHVYEAEKIPGNDLYTDYALRNFQEFWAESVEIFFEKPVKLKNNYPELYAAISDLLNQDPARHEL